MFRIRPSILLTLVLCGLIGAPIVLLTPGGFASENQVDLDGNPLNGAESRIVTRVLQTYPVRIENVIYNNATGDAFTFDWPAAGPGGFRSFVVRGPSVGTKWEWTTVSQVYTIQNPVTFSKDSRGIPTFGAPPGGIQPSPSTPGAFVVPGKSIFPTTVTVSSATLTSSLVTFFSPENEVATCGGSFTAGRYEQTITNNSTEPVTFMVEQQDCCLEPQQIICPEGCQSYLTDAANCGGCGIECADDEFCDAGTCQPSCPGTVCEETCTDLSNDRMNCGACGNVCAANRVCADSSCAACRLPTPSRCGNTCVDLKTDPVNCGGCDIACDFSICPSGIGTCYEGDCICDPLPMSAAATRQAFEPAAGPQRLRGESGPFRPDRRRAGARTTVSLAAAVVEAPVCELQPVQQVIPAGGSFTQCQTGAWVGKEVFTTATVQMDGKTVGQGPCAVIVPAEAGAVPPFLPSPVAVNLTDTSGDDLCQPGETCSLLVSVQNLGGSSFSSPVARLLSPPDEFNPLALEFLQSTSNYPDFPPFAGGGDCETPAVLDPRQNFVAFSFTVPSGQDGDIGRVFHLELTDAGGTGTPVIMPFVIGIGGACDPATDIDGETYDGIDGLLEPVGARLVAEGNPVHVSNGGFSRTRTIPLKLRLRCGSQVLGSAGIDPSPEIVALVHETLGPQPLDNINGDNGANPGDPFFECGESRCEYQFRTRDLPLGTFVITVEMPDSRKFQAGFVISP